MEFDRLHQSVTASLQRLYILVRPGSVIEVTAKLRETTIDGLIGRGTTTPDIVHKVISCDQVSIVAGKREQHLKYLRLRTLFLIATAQNAVPRENLPFPNGESLEEIFFCWHRRPLYSK
jgi:hypothetical protein